MSPRSVLITGGNRGIGLELVKQLVKLSDPPQYVFATFRQPGTSSELLELASKVPAVRPIHLDVRDTNAYTKLVDDVAAVVGEKGLNVLINNAGISPAGQQFNSITRDQLLDAYDVNAVSPFLLTRALCPLLIAASKTRTDDKLSWSRSAVVNVSTILGSISETTTTYSCAYRMSKAALNMGTKCLSIELKPNKILVVAIHPGWVKTDMGGPRAQLEVADSVRYIINTLAQLDENKNGAYLSYDGSEIQY